MSLQHAILGFLSWCPLSGYDLKKCFVDSTSLYWSGNNNQIYTTLIQLHKAGLVLVDIQIQESLPARKVYTITEQGTRELRSWILSSPELPELKNTFLIQLAWADMLEPAELDSLLAQYTEELELQIRMHHEKVRRSVVAPRRTPREIFLWNEINRNISLAWETELGWVREIRTRLKEGKSE